MINSRILSSAAILAMKREKANIVVATALFFESLSQVAPVTSLEKVLVSHKGGTWGESSVEGIGYPVLRSSNMRGKRVDVSDAAWCHIPKEQALAFTLETGDILVTKSSGSSDLVGKAAIFLDPENGNRYLFSNFTMRLRPNKKKVLPKYLAWFLRSPQSLSWRFENQQTTVGLRNLQTKEYLGQELPIPDLEVQQQIVDFLNAIEVDDQSAYSMPLPSVLEEQRRIVGRIEALAGRIAEAQRLRREAVEEGSILINNSARYLLVPQKHWQNRTIASVSTMSTGTTPPSERLDYYGGKMLWYTPGDLSFTKYLGRSSRTVSDIAIKDKKVRIFTPGTVLLVAIGASLGKVGVATQFCSSNQQITGITFFPDILPDYGFWWMRYLYVELRASASQATLPIINQKRIGEFSISFPSLFEQRRIVAYLDGLQARVEALRSLQAASQRELDALLPSVLDRAFRGEL